MLVGSEDPGMLAGNLSGNALSRNATSSSGPSPGPSSGNDLLNAPDWRAAVDMRVIQIFALVGEAFAGATDALLSGEREVAIELARRDEIIDERCREVDASLLSLLTERRGTVDELTYSIGVLRMLPELERSGDLAEHIASRAIRGLGREMSPRSRGLVERMGEVALRMWRLATDAYADRSLHALEGVEDLDDEMDDLHVTLTAELLSATMPLPVAVELALVGRFYERFGDHAVNLARRSRILA